MFKNWFLSLVIACGLIGLAACRSSSPESSGVTLAPILASVSVTPTAIQLISSIPAETPTPTQVETSRVHNDALAQSINAGLIQGRPLFSPDGASLAVPTSRGVAFYAARTFTLQGLLEVETGAQYLAFSPDGMRLASGGGWHVQLWQKNGMAVPDDWKLLRALTGSTSSPDSTLVDLDFSPDGQLLAAGFRSPANPPDGAILMWAAQDGEFHTSMVGMTFDFSPVQPRLVAIWQGSGESTIYSYSFTGAPTVAGSRWKSVHAPSR